MASAQVGTRREFRAFGIPFDHKVARFEEAFTIIRRLLARERVSFAGRFYQTDDAVLLPAPIRQVPVLVGASGPRVIALSSAHIAYWNSWYSWYGNTPSGFAKLSSNFEGNFRRSACVLVTVGADEVILVLDPINERSVVTVAEELGLDPRV